MISSILSLILGCLLTKITSNNNITTKIFYIYVVISIFIIWALLLVIISRPDTPKIETIKIVSFFNKGKKCLIAKTKLLNINSYVTAYFVNDKIENYFFTAIVTNIQEDGLIQAEIINNIQNNNLILQIQNNSINLEKLRIKPIITSEINERSSN